jgi:hypothetical protein
MLRAFSPVYEKKRLTRDGSSSTTGVFIGDALSLWKQQQAEQQKEAPDNLLFFP